MITCKVYHKWARFAKGSQFYLTLLELGVKLNVCDGRTDMDGSYFVGACLFQE